MQFNQSSQYPLADVSSAPTIDPVEGFFHTPDNKSGAADSRRAYRVTVGLGFQTGPLRAVVIGAWSFNAPLNRPVYTVVQAFVNQNANDAWTAYPAEPTTNGSLLATLGALISEPRFALAPEVDKNYRRRAAEAM